jgi:hypothetical protein
MKGFWNRHLSDGQIQSYMDGQSGQKETAWIKAHIVQCPDCRTRVEETVSRTERIATRFHSLQTGAGDILPTRAARARLETTIHKKENPLMIKNLFSRRYRMFWTAASVLAVLAVLFTIPQVRAIAVDFLGLFRIEQVTVVQIDPSNLPQQLGDSGTFQQMFTNNVKIEQEGELQAVSSTDELDRLAGFPVRLPDGMEGQPVLQYQPGGKITLTVDVQQMRAILKEIGREDIQIPDELDGENVVATLSGAAIAQYGKCEYDSETMRQEGYDPDSSASPMTPLCTTLMQMPSPTIEARPGLDIKQIGTAYMELLGMSPEQAAQFSQNVDWTTTLVIPIPTNAATYSTVSVDGVEGTLMTSRGGSTGQYALIWVKDGLLNFITGPGDEAAALAVAGSLK